MESLNETPVIKQDEPRKAGLYSLFGQFSVKSLGCLLSYVYK